MKPAPVHLGSDDDDNEDEKDGSDEEDCCFQCSVIADSGEIVQFPRPTSKNVYPFCLVGVSAQEEEEVKQIQDQP